MKETTLFSFETVLTFIIVSAGNDCFVVVASKYNEIFLFSVTNGNLTLLFFTREYLIQLELTNRRLLLLRDV